MDSSHHDDLVEIAMVGDLTDSENELGGSPAGRAARRRVYIVH